MTLSHDLEAEMKEIFPKAWDEEDTTVVPAPEDLRLNSNHAKHLTDAVVLYADLDGSTAMVESKTWQFAAEIYKAYLRCASLIVKSEGSVITAYDGDRLMAVFAEGAKNTAAAVSALKIGYAIENIIKPAYKRVYTSTTFELQHCVGVDTSHLRAARIGVRGDNDIVWVGRAANYAAKLTSLPGGPVWITGDVYNAMLDRAKTHNGTSTGTNMWEARSWTAKNNMTIYRTAWTFMIP